MIIETLQNKCLKLAQLINIESLLLLSNNFYSQNLTIIHVLQLSKFINLLIWICGNLVDITITFRILAFMEKWKKNTKLQVKLSGNSSLKN